MKEKADVIFKEFWRSNARFANLFNTVLFEGEQLLRPEYLEELDTDVSGKIEMGDYCETLERTRDVVKKSAFGVDFAVWGLENQKKVHYAMPLRTMIYDGLSYLKEYRTLTDDRQGQTQDEFLSKMRKGERLHPVVTRVVYYSEKEIWRQGHRQRASWDDRKDHGIPGASGARQIDQIGGMDKNADIYGLGTDRAFQ